MESTKTAGSYAVVPMANIPFIETFPRRLHIAVGACKLVIRPAEEGHDEQYWAAGTYRGYAETQPVEITQEGNTVRISLRHEWDDILRVLEGVPTLELFLGKSMSYELEIETGASENYLDLGGLPITRLTIRQGAGKAEVDFSSPNPFEMDRLFVGSGAGSIELRHLLNSNAVEMSLEGGAAYYKLDFGGTLRHAMNVKVSAAMSSVDLIIPPNTPAKIVQQALMGGINVGDGYLKKDEAYWTEAAAANLQPLLSIHATLTMGSLNLRNA